MIETSRGLSINNKLIIYFTVYLQHSIYSEIIPMLEENINKAKAEYIQKRPGKHCVEISPQSKTRVYDFASKSYLTSPVRVLQISSQLSDGQHYVCLNCVSLLKPGPHNFLTHPILGRFCPDCTPVCPTHGDYMGLNRSNKLCCLQCLPCIWVHPNYIQPYN